jgi:hypothetical protein
LEAEPRKLEPFIEAYKQKMKLTQEQISFISWLTGMYATHAIAACFGKKPPVSKRADFPGGRYFRG